MEVYYKTIIRYISLLSGRQLDKTESFFLVARLQSIFIWSHNQNLS